MRVKSVQLKGFKRFADLEICDIPESAKLVLLVGPNGSGKSSIFDGFLYWHRNKFSLGGLGDHQFYSNTPEAPTTGSGNQVRLEFHNNPNPTKGCLYVRTAYRNDPDFTINSLSKLESPVDNPRVTKTIDNDRSVSQNYQRLVYDTTAGVYSTKNEPLTVKQLKENLIGKIRDSMQTVFTDLLLESISNPLDSGSFFFEKGKSKGFHYKNLSGGEKSAFDLLLDIHLKRKFFRKAIYCLDELETHLHTALQGPLLKEVMNLIPEDSQLWISTHSLGVIRAAQELSQEVDDAVVCLDFGSIDADEKVRLMPSPPDRLAWEKMLSIALDDLSERLAPEILIVCEGSDKGKKRRDFDASIYNTVLGRASPHIVFVSGGSANEVQANGERVKSMLEAALPTTCVLKLIDRDDLSDSEVLEKETQGTIVLGRRNIESYLLDDEVLSALIEKEGKQENLQDVLDAKKSALLASASPGRNNPVDDLKSAAGQIYNCVKQILSLRRCGNTADRFMQDTLATLIKPGTTVYSDLHREVVEKAIEMKKMKGSLR